MRSMLLEGTIGRGQRERTHRNSRCKEGLLLRDISCASNHSIEGVIDKLSQHVRGALQYQLEVQDCICYILEIQKCAMRTTVPTLGWDRYLDSHLQGG